MRNVVIISAIAIVMVAAITIAAPPPYNSPVAAKEVANREAVKALKASPEWIDLDADIDAFDADYIVATNAVAAVVDNKTQTALNKVLKVVKDHQKVDRDIKKLIKAMVEKDQ